ncbi:MULTISPECIES: hypothetical protein [Vibrio]|jgi:hypothetical protein|uniref:Heat shock protein HtpX n=3 Tax=Vibrio TaxID=662 RepID=A0A240EEI7_9VIBR|nr:MULTISPECIES: hypothetical protein [Vibrio]EDL52112.1 hypothetical protein VSAK1_00105 [Vibrio mediterranei AK1]MCF4174619.1 hypothetical protein [Vibrio sp. McD22-P3]MCG9626980.1 hypothetical protein [Vibrio mediterranei]MCG9660570.1 hypothetical protein [Vibrio mediterranei]MCG9664804.1 hypothetical protein [Vibrio mediterranei]
MVENNNFQMAIDLLCCHLGISEDEAREQLGIQDTTELDIHLMETQSALMGLSEDK